MALTKNIGIPIRPGSNLSTKDKKILWQRQRGFRWCWAACASMVLRASGAPKKQCKIAKEALKGSCAVQSCNSTEQALSSCDVGYPAKDIEALWKKFQVQPIPANKALEWPELVEELDIAPVEALLGRSDDQASGHLVLLIDTAVDSSGTEMVLVADPASDRRDLTPTNFKDVQNGLGWGKWSFTWTRLKVTEQQ